MEKNMNIMLWCPMIMFKMMTHLAQLNWDTQLQKTSVFACRWTSTVFDNGRLDSRFRTEACLQISRIKNCRSFVFPAHWQVSLVENLHQLETSDMIWWRHALHSIVNFELTSKMYPYHRKYRNSRLRFCNIQTMVLFFKEISIVQVKWCRLWVTSQHRIRH